MNAIYHNTKPFLDLVTIYCDVLCCAVLYYTASFVPETSIDFICYPPNNEWHLFVIKKRTT